MRCSSVKKSKVTVQIGRNTRKFHRKNYISCETNDNEEDCPGKCSTRIFVCKKIWEQHTGHSLVLVLRRSGILSRKTVHEEFGTKLQKGCCWNSLRADVQFSVLRLHCPEVNSKAKDMVNCRYTMQPILETIETIFRILVSANQLSLYGAVARKNGATCCDGTINRAQCDQDRSSFWIVMTQRINIFFCNKMKNELRRFHNKDKLSNSVWMEDF